MNIPYTISKNGIVAHVTGAGYTKPYMALPDHRNFEKIKELLLSVSGDISALVKLFNPAVEVVNYCSGKIAVEHGLVKYKGVAVHNAVTDMILKFMDAKQDATPVINFLGRLLANPSWRAREELFAFREHRNMPITPDGKFHAYKGVRPDYNDKYSNTICNKVGEAPRMLRESVCDDSNTGCGPGFHAGSLSYASDWAGPDGHVMIVEIDPADVCSIPHDCGHQKLRCCHYVVKSELAVRDVPLSDTASEPVDYIQSEPPRDDESNSEEEDSYDDGYEDGFSDASLGREGANTAGTYISYENGYADGFSDGKRGEGW